MVNGKNTSEEYRMKEMKECMPIILGRSNFSHYTRVFLAFVLLFGLSGPYETEDCWTQPFHDAGKSAHTDSEILLPLVVTQEYVLRGAEFIWGHPIMSKDYIIITGFELLKYPIGFYLDRYATNKVYCFSVKSGEKIWMLDVGHVDNSPLISKDFVLIPADTLLCYNIETGELAWEREITAEFTPTLDRDTAYVIASEPDSGLYAVDIRNGQFWRIDRNAKNIYTFEGYITVADGTLYLPYSTDIEWGILAMDCHTGNILWKNTKHPCRQRHGRVILCDKESLYFINTSFELLALSKETGELLWTFGEDLSLFGNPSADDSYIYTYSRSTNSIWCIDKNTGDAVWQSESIFPNEDASHTIGRIFLVSSKDHVFISQYPNIMYPKSGFMYGSCEFFIRALDSRTGALVWTSRAFGFPPGPFVLCRNSLVVGSGSKVFVLGHLEEEPEEDFPPLEPFIPLICAGTILICCLLCFILIWAHRHHRF